MAKEPLDRSVYIRRRIIVLIGLLAVIAAVVLVIVKPGSGGAQGEAQVEVPKDLPRETPEPENELQTCTAGQLVITPIVSQESYAEGELPQLSLSVENTGDEACAADLGTAHMQFMITSGSDEVWRSVDCQKNPETRIIELAADQVLETETVEWDRTRSSPETCEAEREPVIAGGATYHLSAVVAGVQGRDTAPFLLY